MSEKHIAPRKQVALAGAELEENLALRYMASSLDEAGHQVEIVEFNDRNDIPDGVRRVVTMNPDIVGLSMIFTARAGEFCSFATRLRESGYSVVPFPYHHSHGPAPIAKRK